MNDAAWQVKFAAYKTAAETQITALRAEVERQRQQLAYLGGTVEVLSLSEQKLNAQLSARDAEVRALRGFALELVSDEWCLNTEGLQEVMEKHGLLKETHVTEPCGPDCYCETEYGEDIFPTDCYMATPLLTGEPGPGGEG